MCLQSLFALCSIEPVTEPCPTSYTFPYQMREKCCSIFVAQTTQTPPDAQHRPLPTKNVIYCMHRLSLHNRTEAGQGRDEPHPQNDPRSRLNAPEPAPNKRMCCKYRRAADCRIVFWMNESRKAETQRVFSLCSCIRPQKRFILFMNGIMALTVNVRWLLMLHKLPFLFLLSYYLLCH